ISGNVSSAATANTYQRKVFFEPKAGYYWAFYYDGAAVRYRYSKDGIQWYLPSNTNGNMPTGWPVYSDAATSSPYVFSSGQTVVVASGTQPLTYINECFGGSGCIASQFDSASIYYSLGTLAGNSITWQPDPSTGQLTR